MKIKFNLDDHLPIKKTLELHNMVTVVRAVSHEENKYYLEVFLDQCLYKLQMLQYDRIDVLLLVLSWHQF